MENSIEEDIELLESLLNEGFETMCYEEAQAIKHVLKDYKKLQEEFKQVDHECERLEEKEVRLIKENEQLRTELNSLKEELNLKEDCYLWLHIAVSRGLEIEKLQKENEELKEKESKIYKEVQENLSFEKFLIAKDRKPDLFNQGRFYAAQTIYEILKGIESEE